MEEHEFGLLMVEPVDNFVGAERMAPHAGDVSEGVPAIPSAIPLSSTRRRPSSPVYWRVEGSLLELTTVRPIAFFTWNSQTYVARAARRTLVLVMALLRPFLYAANRVAATRIVHSVLRGITRDRLDLLGEEEFEYKLKPLLKPEGVRHLKALQAKGADVVLVSQGLDHVMRPMDYREPPRITGRRCDGTAAQSGDPATWSVCADPRDRSRGATESGPMGARSRSARAQGIGFSDCAGSSGRDAAHASHCLF